MNLNLKVGDKVFCSIYGKGIVTNIIKDTKEINVLFDKGLNDEWYNSEGCLKHLRIKSLSKWHGDEVKQLVRNLDVWPLNSELEHAKY